MSDDLTKKVVTDEEACIDTETIEDDPAKPENEEVVLEEEINDLKVQLDEALNRYLRLQADFSNYKRRVEKEKEEIYQNANMELVCKILPILDSLDKAEEMGDLGAVQIFKQLMDILQKEGLESIEAIGQSFDPNYHQAIDQVDTEEYESGTVVEDFRKGYCFNGIVIRPSMVRVAK